MDIKPKFIEQRLAKLGKKKSGLAKALGISNSGVTDLIQGKRQIKARELPKLIKYLELQTVPIMGRIGAGAEIEPESEQVPPDGLEPVEIPFPMTEEMIAFEVVGDSMAPRYDEGDVIVVWQEQRRGVEDYFGQEVAVLTGDGKRYLKKLRPGKGKLVNLMSHNNTDPIEGVRVQWIGEIYAIVRAKQVRWLRRGGQRAVG